LTDINKNNNCNDYFICSTSSDGSSLSSMTAEDEAFLFGHYQFEQRYPPFPARHRPTDRYGNILEDKRLP
jgi:hypothetical protein